MSELVILTAKKNGDLPQKNKVLRLKAKNSYFFNILTVEKAPNSSGLYYLLFIILGGFCALILS